MDMVNRAYQKSQVQPMFTCKHKAIDLGKARIGSWTNPWGPHYLIHLIEWVDWGGDGAKN